jgi:hypothetical protein
MEANEFGFLAGAWAVWFAVQVRLALATGIIHTPTNSVLLNEKVEATFEPSEQFPTTESNFI